MREIKFRQPIFSNGVFVKFHYWGFMSEGCFVGPLTSEFIRESQQDTGLLDKNGKEIYAGDLVNFKINMKGDILSYENAEVEVDSVWGATVSPHEAYSLGKCLDIEIIGNIYSNPDLLSKPQQ